MQLFRSRLFTTSLISICCALNLGAAIFQSGSAQAATTAGTLSLGSASYGAVENIGVKLIPVNRSGGSTGTVSVLCKTFNNTASAGVHYTTVSQTLTWANGNSTPQYCHVPILNTTPFMGTRTFFVELSNPTVASLGAITKSTITIYGDAQNSKVALSSATYTVKQNAGSLTVTVARTGYSGGKASVGYATADSNAVAGKDYTSARGTLSWNYGDAASKTFLIPISNATPFVGTKTLAVAISGAAGTAIGTATAIVSIAGDGVASKPTGTPTSPSPPVVSNPPPTAFGAWANVTPAAVNLTDALGCGNYGTETVQVDPLHPSNLYTEFNCQGIWKSTDYGATWTGPINTGSNGAMVSDCAGGITIPPASSAALPTIYESCIRGSGIGFWKSVDGGVNWTRYAVAPTGTSRQDFYPPVVDPYNENHLVMAGHEMDYLVESTDGGHTWTNVPLANGMLENGGTGAIFFINTGNAASTATTWLWMAQQSGGTFGTWRTTNSGAAWVQVDKNEHPHGSSQIYQPDTSGVVYMAGAYSAYGWGVLRSSDYGKTWAHVGGTSNETVVFGTSKNVYSMYGYPIGIGGINDPSFEIAAQPGTGSWVAPGTPAGLTQGTGQIRVVNDGTHNIFVGAMWNSGVWRYVEP